MLHQKLKEQIDSSTKFIDKALQAAAECLHTGGLDDHRWVLKLGDETRQDQHTDRFVTWGEGLEKHSEQRLQLVA